ncbi:MAG: ribonuclease PH [Christensenellales bacterium]|jgi:ribonuclease PH
MRIDGRANDQLRKLDFLPNFIETAHGSVIVSFGKTRVLCTAILENDVPPFLAGRGRGWLTAEYAMLPASTGVRKKRDGIKQDGRSVEIQRLIGRSLRAVCDFGKLGERCVRIDCDVLQADGGTRTAAITGAYVALMLAAKRWVKEGVIGEIPVRAPVAAVSCGIVGGQPMLDLCYSEDSRADVDCNFVMSFEGEGEWIEVQATGEGRSFSKAEMAALSDLAEKGIREIVERQRAVIDGEHE